MSCLKMPVQKCPGPQVDGTSWPALLVALWPFLDFSMVEPGDAPE